MIELEEYATEEALVDWRKKVTGKRKIRPTVIRESDRGDGDTPMLYFKGWFRPFSFTLRKLEAILEKWDDVQRFIKEKGK